jgi:hypothetical protein
MVQPPPRDWEEGPCWDGAVPPVLPPVPDPGRGAAGGPWGVAGASIRRPLQPLAEQETQLFVSLACRVDVHDRRSRPRARLGGAGTVWLSGGWEGVVGGGRGRGGAFEVAESTSPGQPPWGQCVRVCACSRRPSLVTSYPTEATQRLRGKSGRGGGRRALSPSACRRSLAPVFFCEGNVLRSDAPRWALFPGLLLALLCPVGATSPAARAAPILINNGLAPPNPANVIDDETHATDSVHVRNTGCPPDGDPVTSPCPSPGNPTSVSLIRGASLITSLSLHVYDTSVATIDGASVAGGLYARDSSEVTMNDG